MPRRGWGWGKFESGHRYLLITALLISASLIFGGHSVRRKLSVLRSGAGYATAAVTTPPDGTWSFHSTMVRT